MDGNVEGFFQRLTGGTVQSDTTVTLSSAQIGAAQSWLRRSGVAFNKAVLISGRFSMAELLANGVPSAPVSTDGLAGGAKSLASAGSGQRIAIDIEHVGNMPDCHDFRLEPFYADNFSSREIAYCLERSEPRESFCGLWAAKEAIRKLGFGSRIMTDLKSIEIDHDDTGAPVFGGVALSISHAGAMAAAVATVGAEPLVVEAPKTVKNDEEALQQLLRLHKKVKYIGFLSAFLLIFSLVEAVVILAKLH